MDRRKTASAKTSFLANEPSMKNGKFKKAQAIAMRCVRHKINHQKQVVFDKRSHSSQDRPWQTGNGDLHHSKCRE